LPSRPLPVGLLTSLAFVISFMYALYVAAFGLILPAVGAAFQVGAAAQGALFPASFGGGMVGVLLSGYLSDRLGRKPVGLLCLGVVVLGAGLFGTATAFPAALLAATLLGAGGAASQTVASALLSDLHPTRRPFYMNAIQIAFGVGAVVSTPLMQAFLTISGSWRYLFLLVGIGFAAILVTLSFCTVPEGERSGIDFTILGRLARHPALWLFCSSAAFYAGAEVAFFSWMPTLLQKEIPSGAGYAAGVGSLFWAAMTVGRALTGSIIHRFPLRRLRFLLASASAVTATMTLIIRTPEMLLTGVALTGLCFSGIFSVLLAEGSEGFPDTAGTVLGMTIASASIGVALLPYAVGAFVDVGASWRLSLGLVPLAAVLVALLATIRVPTNSL
jgi:FHS family glucose/mannose:H+ symporter-like MFS transporter